MAAGLRRNIPTPLPYGPGWTGLRCQLPCSKADQQLLCLKGGLYGFRAGKCIFEYRDAVCLWTAGNDG
jgi:hypothetical protein